MTKQHERNSSEPFSFHKIGGRHLAIAPETGTWIACDEQEMSMLARLLDGVSAKDVVKDALLAIAGDPSQVQEVLDSWSRLVRFYDSATDPLRIAVRDGVPRTMLNVNVTERCNLRCSHCYIDATTGPGEDISCAALGEAMRGYAERCPGGQVVLTGGEPLLHPGLVEILETAKLLGLQTVLFTNGTLLTEERLEEIHLLVDRVQISLDGASKQAHERIRGAGTFDLTIDAIRRVQRRGIYLQVAVTVTPDNVQDLTANHCQLADLLSQPNTHTRIGAVFLEGRASRTWAATKAHQLDEAVESITASFAAIANIGRGWEERPAKKNCIGATMFLYANGDMYPCREVKELRIGNIYDEPFEAILAKNSALYTSHGVEEISLCSDCDVKYICGGGCRVANLRINGDALKPVCDDDRRQRLYGRLAAGQHSFQISSDIAGLLNKS